MSAPLPRWILRVGEECELCDRAVEALREAGAEVRDVSLPHTALAIPAYYIIAPAEASSNLARFDAMRYGMRLGDDGTAGAEEVMARTRGAGFGARGAE